MRCWLLSWGLLQGCLWKTVLDACTHTDGNCAIGVSAADVEPSCPADGSRDVASCKQGSSQLTANEFWAGMRRHGLKLNIKRTTVEEPAFAGQPARNRTAMVLSDDVFYGRAILKIPRHALLSIETAPKMELRRELNKFLFEDAMLEKAFNITGEDRTHLLSLAYPLIAEDRDPSSIFREWLDAARSEKMLALELTPRQRKVLEGTTVEGACAEMERQRDIILQTASNISYFAARPVTREEAAWATAVIMRHARLVHPHQDVRQTRSPRMYLFPLVELLGIQLNPDPGVAIAFQEEITLDDNKEEEMVLQIARRDMAKGEEIFAWPGRMSNSELVLRHGITFQKNPTGVGDNATLPQNWSPNKDTKVRKEFELYNCSSEDNFELRFGPTGWPHRDFVRCYRIAWFLDNGWYTPALKSRMRELNKWPPPKKYSKDDWLSWTQADADINRVILNYCKRIRERLKDTIDTETANEFRASSDPTDKLLWHLRSEESKTFKECIALALKVGGAGQQ